jgi:hypothetical protein
MLADYFAFYSYDDVYSPISFEEYMAMLLEIMNMERGEGMV